MELEKVIGSKARSEIFRLLFGPRNNELHLRAIERSSGISAPSIRQELMNLMKLDLIKVREDGNRHYYRANVEHPLFGDIRNIVLKTSGLIDILRSALDRKGIRVAFVFGSIAANQDDSSSSDIDLMIIGNVPLRTVADWLSGVSEKVGREINPYVMSLDEFEGRIAEDEHFLTSVLKSPKLFIVGNQFALEELGKQR
jgi:DNA-binding transcriptional ArsR family regulator